MNNDQKKQHCYGDLGLLSALKLYMYMFQLKTKSFLCSIFWFLWEIPKAWLMMLIVFLCWLFWKSWLLTTERPQSPKKSKRHQAQSTFCHSLRNTHYLILEKEGQIKARMEVLRSPVADLDSLLRLPMGRSQLSRISKLKAAIRWWLFHPKTHHYKEQRIEIDLQQRTQIIIHNFSSSHIAFPAVLVLARERQSSPDYLINSTQPMRMPFRLSKAHILRQRRWIVAKSLFPGWTLQNAWFDRIAAKKHSCLLTAIYVKP